MCNVSLGRAHSLPTATVLTCHLSHMRNRCLYPSPQNSAGTVRCLAPFGAVVGGPQDSARVQLAKIEDGGSDAEQKLLIAVKAKNPDASPTELLILFQVCCRRRALVACSACRLCAASCVLRIAPGLASATSGLGLGAAPATSALDLGSPLPHLH